MTEPIRQQWLAESVSGRTFAEVGGLWGLVNEQISVASALGAAELTMIDVAPEGEAAGNLWEDFRVRLHEFGVPNVRCIRGNIDDPATVAEAGSFEVVHCSGVLYHCPEPLHTLRNLRSITRRTLVLGTATIPEQVTTSAGSLHVEPGSALLAPAMPHTVRAVLGDWLRENGAPYAHGINYNLDTAWDSSRSDWSPYEPWWWFFTRDYVAALLKVAGFEIRNIASYWNGRATFYLASARADHDEGED